MEDALKNKLDAFWNVCEKGPSRYRSWIWCYEKFQSNFFKKELNKETYDYLALNLAFYLASWGMYRGSSLILQLDYKVYIGLLENLHKIALQPTKDLSIEDQINYLEKYKDSISEAYITIFKYFNSEREAYHKIDNFYLAEPTATLATKILMGIYGVTPAFDRFFANGIAQYKKENNNSPFSKIPATWFDEKVKIDFKENKQNIRKKQKSPKEKFVAIMEALINFASNFDIQKISNYRKIKIKINNEEIEHEYFIPIMKYIDTIFWQIGYETGLYELVEEYNKSESKSNEKFKKIEKLCAYCGKNCKQNNNNEIEILEKGLQ